MTQIKLDKKDNKHEEVDTMKIFQTIEDHKQKLMSDDDISDEQFQNGLENLMDKIMDGIVGKKEGEKNE